MKDIKEQYQPVTPAFKEELNKFNQKGQYVRIHYFNDYHEYISTAAIIKEITNNSEYGEFLKLSTGEEVRLDKIVRFDGNPAPGYEPSDFTCDC